MKKAFYLLLLLFCITARAEYSPTTMWPYLYEDFTEGLVMYKSGSAIKGKLNIHLEQGELQYIEGDAIMTTDLRNVEYAIVGTDKFVVAEQSMMKVIEENDARTAFVLLSVLGDFEALYVGTGAYGSSANTQAVRSQSSLEIGGKNVVSHAKLLAEKKEDSGKSLSTKEKLYIKVGDESSLAYQKDIEKIFGLSGNQEWKSFLKANKIKWRKTGDLFKVVEFISSTLK